MGAYEPDQFARKQNWPAASAFAAIGTVLLLSSFFFPWWGMIEYDKSGDDTEASLEHLRGLSPNLFDPKGLYFEEAIGETHNTFMLYFVVSLLVIGGVAIGAATLPIQVSFGFGLTGKRTAIMVVAIAMVLAFLGPVLLMALQPDMMTKDAEADYDNDDGSEWEAPDRKSEYDSFIGSAESNTRQDVEYKWGPDLGFFLSLIAGVMFLISTVLIVLSKSADGQGKIQKGQKGKSKKGTDKSGSQETSEFGAGEQNNAISGSSAGLMDTSGFMPPTDTSMLQTPLPATPGPEAMTGAGFASTPPLSNEYEQQPSSLTGSKLETGEYVACPQCATQIKTPPTRPAKIACPSCGLKGTIN